MKIAILMTLFFSICASASDVYVQGYQRSDGTYVQPHTRSAPDSYKWNNYGRPSSQDVQMQQETYERDQDHDNIYNQYDMDDDNDGINDDSE
jgi:hypothetical protein